METDPSKLRRAAEFLVARRTLALAGTWSVVFAAASIVAGCMWQPVDWVLTVLGVALLGTGVWNMCSPRPTGIVLDAVTLLLVGAYNLAGAILAMMDELPPSPARAFLGALQLVWGIQRLRNFRQFANAFLERPVDSEAKEIEQVVWAIRRALAKGSTDVIELAVGSRHRAWKARFMGEHAVFVELAGPGLLVGTRATVVVTPRSNHPKGGALVADLAVGATRLSVTFDSDALRVFEQWKGAPASRPAAA